MRLGGVAWGAQALEQVGEEGVFPYLCPREHMVNGGGGGDYAFGQALCAHGVAGQLNHALCFPLARVVFVVERFALGCAVVRFAVPLVPPSMLHAVCGEPCLCVGATERPALGARGDGGHTLISGGLGGSKCG